MRHVALFIAAIATFATTPTIAQDAARAGVDLAPSMSLDVGIGAATVGVSGTRFGVDAQPGYHVSGTTLGLMHPSGMLIYATTHYFPFKFRALGLVTTVEGVSLTNDGTVGKVQFGNAASPDGGPSLVSVMTGPEAQLRHGMFLFRGAVLGGMRTLSSGDFSAFEGRLAIHAQTDLVFGGGSQGNSGFSFGVLGGTDIYPAFGWSAGMSLSFAMF